MNARYAKGLWMIGLAVLLGCSGAAMGQNPYGAPPAYYPGGYPGGYYPGRVGGAYMGAADLVNAQGQLGIQQEQARVERQKADQAKLVTQKQAFNEMMYEKANTATLTENLSYDSQLIMKRMMTSPLPAEITRGQTLNAMMPMVASLSLRGTQGPPIYLNQDLLQQINVTVGKGGYDMGMLTSGGSRLDWPLVLQSSKQQQVAKEIPVAVAQAKSGSLDAKLYREINKQLANIREDMRTQFHKEQIDGGEFLDGQRFLDSLDKSMIALREPIAQRVLDGSYAARGRTVPELVNYMTGNGLSFAGGVPGTEAAYYAMHDAFVGYTNSAMAAAGIHTQYAPPRTQHWQVKP